MAAQSAVGAGRGRSLASHLDAALAARESRALLAFVSALLLLMLAQFAYGLWADSLGLISDAFHMAFHCAALATSLWGVLAARQQQRSFAFSYGFERYEVLAAFSNSLFLIFVCVFVIAGALHRLLLAEPRSAAKAAAALAAGAPFWFGVAGIAVNVAGVVALGPGQGSLEQLLRYQQSLSTASLAASGAGSGGGGGYGKGAAALGGGGGGGLPTVSSSAMRGGAGGNVNARAVFLHAYADAVSSVAVVVAALARRYLGLASADTLQAAFVACFTLYIAVPLFTATGMLLLQTTPPTLRSACVAHTRPLTPAHHCPSLCSHSSSNFRFRRLERCRREILTVDGVLEVLDERWWTQSPGFTVGSLTVRARGDASERDVIARIQRSYGRHITDLTVQVEKDPPLSWLTSEGSVGVGIGASAGGPGGGGLATLGVAHAVDLGASGGSQASDEGVAIRQL